MGFDSRGRLPGGAGWPSVREPPAGWPSGQPRRPPRTGAGPPGRYPSRQPLPRHRAAGPPGGHSAPPPGQHFGFPAGKRKRIPHPKGNGGKHIGKIVSLPPRTPPGGRRKSRGIGPMAVVALAWGRGTRATAAGTPPAGPNRTPPGRQDQSVRATASLAFPSLGAYGS
jgi:hypothetical protein